MAEMTDEQRLRLAEAVRRERLGRYGTKSAAYQAAGINSATWDRIEAGERVKDHTLTSVIKLLWHSSYGDWRHVPGVLTPHTGLEMMPGEPGDPEYAQYTVSMIDEVRERVERLERFVYDREAGESGGDTAATKPGPDGPAPSNVTPLKPTETGADESEWAARPSEGNPPANAPDTTTGEESQDDGRFEPA